MQEVGAKETDVENRMVWWLPLIEGKGQKEKIAIADPALMHITKKITSPIN